MSHANRTDIVEDVCLNAFDRFAAWPSEVPLREWLEGLIEPAIRDLALNDEEEKVAVSLARTAAEVENG
jgi:hypothetical protein